MRCEKPTPTELQLMFDIAEKLYAYELERSGLNILPYAFAKDNVNTGRLVVVSEFGKYSKAIENHLKQIV